MIAWLAVVLIVLGVANLAINLYFVTLFWPVPGWLTRSMGRAMRACGVDGGSCARVVKTPYARLLAGRPNVVAGLPWSALCIVLGGACLATGTLYLWELAFCVALASVAMGAYLTWALLVALNDP